MAKNKYYVVWVGNRPGIYLTWNEAEAQVKNFPEAKYKSFLSMTEAEKAFEAGWKKSYSSSTLSQKSNANQRKSSATYIENALAVDAACSGNPGDMEYRGVNVKTRQEVFRIGPLKQGTNNIGEFLALVHGLAFLKKMNRTDLPIYSDSKTAIGWIKKGKANTKLERTGVNERIFQLLDKAHIWLANNKVENPIIKWETEIWGEIPADFGRK